MISPQRPLTASDLSAYLEPLDLKPKQRNDSVGYYQEAAAVLTTITDPRELISTARESGDAEEMLASDLVDAPVRRTLGVSRMLRYEVRRDALARLGSREAILKALEANPHERTGVAQQRFEDYVRGEVEPLEKQSIEDLEGTLQAALWVDHLDLTGVPQIADIRLALSRARFVDPFKRFAGVHFHGRRKELDDLRDFVGVIEPETLPRRALAAISRLLKLKRKPALNLYGPGGIGKSALLMRFFLEHFELPEEHRVPFAYLNFDSPFLNIEDVSTLSAEIFRQLRLQFPGITEASANVDPAHVPEELAGLLSSLSQSAQQPFLLVLDTFEEVQYGGEARAHPLWKMLNDLQARWPFIRVLISGRVPVKSLVLDGRAPVPMELSGLDNDAAMAVLASLGISSHVLAATLIKQVGRLPLSLRLAAAVVAREGASSIGVKDLETSSYVFFSVSDEVIQGQLYERILGHLHSRELEKLAHPGLVLRRVSADLILKVLKGPCELSITSSAEAKVLYDMLALETALVSEEDDQSLLHRPDVRRTMLRLLVSKEPRKAEDIRRRAVEYYKGREEPGATAEELYHRLMLGESPRDREIDFYRPDVRRSLSRSMSELQVASQLFLAELGYEVPPEISKQASQEQLEILTAARIRELLPHGPSALAEAEGLLKSASYRGANSPLYMEEARIRFLQGRYDDVVTLTNEGLRYAFEAHDQPRVLELVALKTWTLEEATRIEDLALALPYFAETASRLQRPLFQIQALAQQCRLAVAQYHKEPARKSMTELAELLKRLDATNFSQIAPVLKDIVAPSTQLDPEVLRVIGPLVLIGRARTSAVATIFNYLTKLLDGEEKAEAVRAFVPPSSKFQDALLVAEGLVSLVSAFHDRKDILIGAAGVIDDVLREWPDRLPYLQYPSSGVT